MTYVCDRVNGNRIYRIDENECMMLDPLQNEWTKAAKPEYGVEISGSDAALYEKALSLAHKAHAGQKDKAGKDYIHHPLTVSSFTDGPFVCVIAALLHDIVEDTPNTLDDLRNMGFSEEIVACVDALTRRTEEKRDDYLQRLSGYTDAIYVKLADLKHNSDLTRLPNITQKDLYRVEKYRREAEMLSGILAQRKTQVEK